MMDTELAVNIITMCGILLNALITGYIAYVNLPMGKWPKRFIGV